MRKCSKCNIEKNETEFVFKNKAKGILHCVCKVCQREYKKKHYYKNKEAHYIRNQKTKVKLKSIVEIEKNKGCFVCQETFHQCLEFHHLEQKDKFEEIGVLKNLGSERKLLEELKKCVLLCANCHRKVHYDNEFNNKMLKKLNTDVV